MRRRRRGGEDFLVGAPTRDEGGVLVLPEAVQARKVLIASTAFPSLKSLSVAAVTRFINSDPSSGKEKINQLPLELRGLILSQLHYSALKKLFGETIWQDKEIDFLTLLGSIKQEEDVYRWWYWAIANFVPPQSLLFDLFDKEQLEAKICHEERDKNPELPSSIAGKSMVVPSRAYDLMGKPTTTFGEFKDRFDAFTQGRLKGVNWNNIVVVGGAVTIPLCHQPPPKLPLDEGQETKNVNTRKLKGYGVYAEFSGMCHNADVPEGQLSDAGFLEKYYSFAFGKSDIDIYLYGLSMEDAVKKVSELYHAIQKETAAPLHYACSESVVCLFSDAESGFRPIQIMTNVFQNLEEVLLSTDLNISACGFDGKRIVALPRFVTAARYNLNTLDSSIRLGTKLKFDRLSKYAQRGYATLMPYHIRMHGHGGLAIPYRPSTSIRRGSREHSNTRETPSSSLCDEKGTMQQLINLLSLAKLGLMRHNGTHPFFRWTWRWNAGVTTVTTERFPLDEAELFLSHFSAKPEAGSSTEKLLSEMDSHWQKIDLHQDFFTEASRYYTAFPVEPRMPATDIKYALQEMGYDVFDPVQAEGTQLENVSVRPYADSSFQCFYMDAILRNDINVNKLPTSPYSLVNTSLAKLDYDIHTADFKIKNFWSSCCEKPVLVGPFNLCGQKWVISMEATGGSSNKELVFFKLKWLGTASDNDAYYVNSDDEDPYSRFIMSEAEMEEILRENAALYPEEEGEGWGSEEVSTEENTKREDEERPPSPPPIRKEHQPTFKEAENAVLIIEEDDSEEAKKEKKPLCCLANFLLVWKDSPDKFSRSEVYSYHHIPAYDGSYVFSSEQSEYIGCFFGTYLDPSIPYPPMSSRRSSGSREGETTLIGPTSTGYFALVIQTLQITNPALQY